MMKPSHSYLRTVARILSVGLLLLTGASNACAANFVTLGDSLTAEYDVIPEVPGFDDLPTDYAKVTVPGWEAMSWVEVAGRLRGRYFNFGGWKPLTDPWSPPRLSGYEYNWAVPGVDADQYAEFLSSSFFSNPLYYTARFPLEDQLQNNARRVVIWLGGNDFRGNYGPLYDGRSSSAFVNGLIDDLGKAIDFVKKQRADIQIVVGSVPDLGATPAKKAAHPDPVKRARVTAVTETVNQRLAQLAAEKGVVVAHTYAVTAALVKDEPLYFGGVRILNDKHADNHPRFAFTRDGLHPNTALQIVNLRAINRAFNQGYGAGIPNITDIEALQLMGIDSDQPFFDWLGRLGISDKSFQADSENDGLTQLAEFAFGLNPKIADANRLPVRVGGSVTGFTGDVSVRFTPRADRARYVAVRVQYSADGVVWNALPSARLLASADGSYTGAIPPLNGPAHIRFRVITIPPSGSGARNVSHVTIR